MTTTDVLTDMVNTIVAGFQPLKVILFGSRARGDMRWDSDYDFLVVMPDGTDRMVTIVAILKALADAPVPTDVLVTTPDEIMRRGDMSGSVLKPALSEGKTLYERP